MARQIGTSRSTGRRIGERARGRSGRRPIGLAALRIGGVLAALALSAPPASPQRATPTDDAPEGATAPAPAEAAWVRPELKVNFRASPSNQATPLGIVSTGDEVTVLERRAGWARIEAPGGETGWLSESVLDSDAPPLQRIEELERERTELRQELAAAQSEIVGLEQRQQELRARDEERETLLQQLDEENRVLRAGERWPFMIMGAAILGAGFIGGLLMRGGAARRSSSRIRF